MPILFSNTFDHARGFPETEWPSPPDDGKGDSLIVTIDVRVSNVTQSQREKREVKHEFGVNFLGRVHDLNRFWVEVYPNGEISIEKRPCDIDNNPNSG